MEEMMMLMMNIRSHDQTSSNNNNNTPNVPITCPTWKLYENPFYTSHQKPQQNQEQQSHSSSSTSDHIHDQKKIHRLHLPISTRKIAASFWDLTFIRPFMESELETARAQIDELKSELGRERKARKKMESLNKKLAREISEERKGREALERVCEELAKEISSGKAEISRIRKEIDEERKMMRTAEVIREERVQMKLADAKILLEEKMSELEISKNTGSNDDITVSSNGENVINHNQESSSSFGEKLRFVLREKLPASVNSMAVMQRKVSPEADNPHIKRGIKGFVEFPKAVRAIGCRSSKHLSSKLECQKAQLKILLKQKGSLRFNGLIAG